MVESGGILVESWESWWNLGNLGGNLGDILYSSCQVKVWKIISHVIPGSYERRLFLNVLPPSVCARLPPCFRPCSHLRRILHLIVTAIRHTTFVVANHSLSRLQNSVRVPNCPPRGPFTASTFFIGFLSPKIKYFLVSFRYLSFVSCPSKFPLCWMLF